MKDLGTVRREASYYYPFKPIVPNQWQGECDCVVGPFSSRNVAEYFVNAVVDFGQYERFSRRIFVKGDSWYVEVQESASFTATKVLSS